MGVNQEEVVRGSRTVRAMMIEYHRPGPGSACLKDGPRDTRKARRSGWGLIILALVGHAKDLEFIQSANLCDGVETPEILELLCGNGLERETEAPGPNRRLL